MTCAKHPLKVKLLQLVDRDGISPFYVRLAFRSLAALSVLTATCCIHSAAELWYSAASTIEMHLLGSLFEA